MVTSGQSDRVPEKNTPKEQPPENMVKEAVGQPGVGIDKSIAGAGSVEKFGLATKDELFASVTTKPSEQAVFQRNITEAAEKTLKTAEQLLTVKGGVVPKMVPQIREAVKGIQATLARCAQTMGDEAAAAKRTSK